jgi:hypothetical protein
VRDPDPVVFLCASAAWGITTVYVLDRYKHHTYQYHFLIAGISVSLSLVAVSEFLEELSPHLVIVYTPLWISFVMALSLILHSSLFRHRPEASIGEGKDT